MRIETTPYFEGNVKFLKKRYRRIISDIANFMDRLQQGDVVGAKIAGIGYEVYKARIKNSDIQKGKSGGYRIIYYLEVNEMILLLTIYTKSDTTDIPPETIRQIIEEYLSNQ